MNTIALRKIASLFFTLCFSLLIGSCARHHVLQSTGGEGFDEDIEARTQWENMMLADPATGKIPEHIRAKELAYAATMPVQFEPQYKSGNSFWQNRGPWTLGGRT